MPSTISGNYIYEPLSATQSKNVYKAISNKQDPERISFTDLEAQLDALGYKYEAPYASSNINVEVAYEMEDSDDTPVYQDFRFSCSLDGTNTAREHIGLTCVVRSNSDDIFITFNKGYEVHNISVTIKLTGYSTREAKVKLNATESNWNPNGTMLSTVNIGGYNLDVVNAEGCFENAKFVTKVANLSSKLTNMNRCFKNCFSLSGNIKVSCEPTDWDSIFDGTYQPIYIINDGLSSWNMWRSEIVGSSRWYNVHYEAEYNLRPEILEFQITRTNANGGTSFDPMGKWAYITFTADVFKIFIPDGWTNALSTISLTMNNTAISPTWTKASMESTDVIVYTYKAWVQINTEDLYNFSIQVSDQTKTESGTVKQTRNSSYRSLTLPRPYALVDYYNDNATNKQGIAFGKYAEAANLFDVNMPTILRDKLSLELNDNVTSGTDSDLIKAIDALGWGNILS